MAIPRFKCGRAERGARAPSKESMNPGCTRRLPVLKGYWWTFNWLAARVALQVEVCIGAARRADGGNCAKVLEVPESELGCSRIGEFKKEKDCKIHLYKLK